MWTIKLIDGSEVKSENVYIEKETIAFRNGWFNRNLVEYVKDNYGGLIYGDIPSKESKEEVKKELGKAFDLTRQNLEKVIKMHYELEDKINKFMKI